MADDKNQDEDNFGLPDIEYKPLEQTESSARVEEPVQHEEKKPTESYSSSPSNYYEEEEEESSSSGLVIAIVVGLVILVGGFLAYKFVWLPKKAKQELAAKEKAEAEKREEAEKQAKLAEEERLRKEAEAKAAQPAEGTIETLADRTGKYYVVISSSVDGDLAMDRAKKLSATGTSTKIVPPYGKWKYYRLCIGDFDSFASAQSSADASKGTYGDALWVLKY